MDRAPGGCRLPHLHGRPPRTGGTRPGTPCLGARCRPRNPPRTVRAQGPEPPALPTVAWTQPPGDPKRPQPPHRHPQRVEPLPIRPAGLTRAGDPNRAGVPSLGSALEAIVRRLKIREYPGQMTYRLSTTDPSVILATREARGDWQITSDRWAKFCSSDCQPAAKQVPPFTAPYSRLVTGSRDGRHSFHHGNRGRHFIVDSVLVRTSHAYSPYRRFGLRRTHDSIGSEWPTGSRALQPIRIFSPWCGDVLLGIRWPNGLL